MEKKIYFIEPVFEAKYWGGQALKERYGYTPDLPNIAIAYHVIALPPVSYTHLTLPTNREV